MKIRFANLLVLGSLVAVGCNQGTPGGAGVTASADASKPVATVANKPVLGEADNSYRLNMPFQEVTVKQGDNLNFAIAISRGENFSDEVAIKLEGLPSGVSQMAASPRIERDKTDSQLMLNAADDAALGEFTVKVTGHTTSSEVDATDEFKLTVISP